MRDTGDLPLLKVGLIGCGGRGTGAAEDCLRAAPRVQLVAVADLFADRAVKCLGWLAEQKLPGFRLDDVRVFTGFDAWCRLIDTAGVDLVLLCTPPGFRPLHFAAAVEAGKHVFLEKPVAVDPVGVRRILAAGERAREQRLAVVAGTIYRHHPAFRETIRRVHGGAIGAVRAARCAYNTGGVWRRDRKPGESDMEWQCRNWYYFDWLSGDFIVEQHVHTLDVVNWALGAPRGRAVGGGGRQARTGPEHGNIYDHFAIDYEYPGGVHVLSVCRQIAGTPSEVGAWFSGVDGTAAPYAGEINGGRAWKFEGEAPNPYVEEHVDLIRSIREKRPLNETRAIAGSTLTAILGREAAYTGKTLTWEDVAGSDQDLSPPRYEFGPLAVRPVPMPGT